MSTFYNLGMERAVLASLMSIDNALNHVTGIINFDDFVDVKHKTIYKCIETLSKDGSPYDLVMVIDLLTSQKLIKAAGDEAYIADILTTSPASLFNLIAYAGKIKELSQHRLASQLLIESKDVMNNADIKIDEKMNTIIEGLAKVATANTIAKGGQDIPDLVGGFVDKIQESALSGQAPFIPTGFIELDVKSPVEDGELIIIGARPSMGKTTFALNILQNMVTNQRVADGQRKTGVFFSLEMKKDAVMQRFMSAKSGVDFSKIRSGQNIGEKEWVKLQNAISEVTSDFPLHIDDRSDLTHQQMRMVLNNLRASGREIGCIVIDYLQFMGGIDSNNTSASLGVITKALKAIAKEFDCPIFLLSQLNRRLESRPNKRPIMSDIRDSGNIEQDADLIWFLYRDEVYNEKTEDRGIAEIITAKNRNGQVGNIRLVFQGQYSKFSNFTNTYSEEEIPDYG